MKRRRLKNIANKTKAQDDFQKYKAQRNLVVKMDRRAKRQFYANLDLVLGKDKIFWKTLKSFFSEQSSPNEKVFLVEDNIIISDDKEISNCFNSYFINITDTLCLNEPETIDGYIPSNDAILNAVNKYKSHPSITKIKNRIKARETFFSQPVNSLEVRNEIDRLNRSKKTSEELSTDIVKSIADNCLEYITYYVNHMFASSTFPDKLKMADVSPIFKSGDSTRKKNFRPISVISAMSKIFERLIFKQICPFAYRPLSNLLCAFWEKDIVQNMPYSGLQKYAARP